eukprot:gene4081-5827_t
MLQKISTATHQLFQIRSRYLTKSLSTVANTVSSAEVVNASQYPVLKFKNRTHIGSKISRKMRKEDSAIPGVIYGTDENRNKLKVLVTIECKDILKQLRLTHKSFENTVFKLIGEDGTSYLATPRQTQFSSLNDMPLSVNFLYFKSGVRLKIPVKYINEDINVDLKRGCFIVRVNLCVECICDGVVPSFLIVDIGNAKKGDVLRLSSIKLPPSVRPAKSIPSDYVLGVIQAAAK